LFLMRGEARAMLNNTIDLTGNLEDGDINTVILQSFFKGAYYNAEQHERARGLNLHLVSNTDLMLLTSGVGGSYLLTELMLPYDDWAENFEHGEQYLFVGRLGTGAFSKWVYAGDSVTEYWTDVLIPLRDKPENFLETEEFVGIRELIEIIKQDRFTFDVVYTDNLSDIPRFNNNAMGIVDGRDLTQADRGSLVCVVSLDFAEQNGLKVGDSITLGLGDRLFDQHAGLGALAVTRGRFSRPVTDVELEIVGIYDNFDSTHARGHTAHWSYSAATIFVPLTVLPQSAVADNVPLRPGAFSLVIEDARDISAFMTRAAPVLEGMDLTLHMFDGGWLEIEKELSLSLRISLIAIIVLFVAAMAAIALVVYIYILNKKRDFAIMRATGCPKRQAGMALFRPLLVIAISGIVGGSAAAWLYTALSESLPFSPVYSLICVFGLLVFLCAAAWFGLWRVGQLAPLALLQSSGRVRRRKANPVKEKPGETIISAELLRDNLMRSGLIPGLALQAVVPPVPKMRRYTAARHCTLYVLRNIRRSWMKSVMTIAVAAMLFGAAGQLAAVREAARTLFETMPVKLTMRGPIDPRFNILPLERSELVDINSAYKETVGPEFWTGYNKFTFMGDSVWQDGRQATLIVTSDIERYYGVPVEIEKGENYMTRSPSSMVHGPCVVSGALMDALGLSIGDPIVLYREVNDAPFEAWPIITGRVDTGSESGDYTVILPPHNSYNRGQLTVPHYTYAEYTLTDNTRANELRDIARDLVPFGITYNFDTEELDRVANNLALYDMFFPVIMLTLSLIGGLLPAMMIMQAAKEASLLRALGTTRLRTRTMLSSQQLTLCFTGLALGLLVLLLHNGAELLGELVSSLGQSAGLSSASYIVATLVCAFSVTRGNVLELLQTKE